MKESARISQNYAVSGKKGRLRLFLATLGDIWQYLMKYGKIQRNLTDFGKIIKNGENH